MCVRTLQIKENLSLGKRPLEDVVVWHLPSPWCRQHDGGTGIGAGTTLPDKISPRRSWPCHSAIAQNPALPKIKSKPEYYTVPCSQCVDTMVFSSQSDTCPAWSVPPPTIKHCHHASRASASAQNSLLAPIIWF